jgi:membrane protein
MAAAGDWLEARLGWSVGLAAFAEAFIAVSMLTGLFAFIYKVLPDVQLRWSDVWKGAVTASLLFMLGKFALAWYLGRTDLAADYGSAGALVLILFWVYYTSLILLFGAELTQAQT